MRGVQYNAAWERGSEAFRGLAGGDQRVRG